MNFLTKEEQEKLEKIFKDGCKDFEPKEEYYISGADQGFSYCFDCAKKKVARLQKEKPEKVNEIFVDGGWGFESDHIEACEKCGAWLDNNLLDDGCQEEVEYFLENGFNADSEYECYVMDLVIFSMGWEPFKKNTNFYKDLHELGRQILDDA